MVKLYSGYFRPRRIGLSGSVSGVGVAAIEGALGSNLSLLGGSWDLVSKVISTLIGVTRIYVYIYIYIFIYLYVVHVGSV